MMRDGGALPPGIFGEDLTVSNVPDLVRAGDRIRAGDVLMEVSAPRIPCATSAARMGEPNRIRRIRDAGRTAFIAESSNRVRFTPVIRSNGFAVQAPTSRWGDGAAFLRIDHHA